VEVLQGLGGNGRESGWGGAGMEIKSAETGWIGVISGNFYIACRWWCFGFQPFCLAARVMRHVAVSTKTYPRPTSFSLWALQAKHRPSLSPSVSVWKVLLRTIFVRDSLEVFSISLNAQLSNCCEKNLCAVKVCDFLVFLYRITTAYIN